MWWFVLAKMFWDKQLLVHSGWLCLRVPRVHGNARVHAYLLTALIF